MTVNKPGEYKDFSGTILWNDTKCEVRNSSFTINKEKNNDNHDIIFHDVIFEKGILYDAYVEKGINLGCDIFDSFLENVLWRKGVLSNCTWYDGQWKRGVWKNGFDILGKEYFVNPNHWNDKKNAGTKGYYENFTGRIQYYDIDCIVENATFELVKEDSDVRAENFDLPEVPDFMPKIDPKMIVFDGKFIKGNVCNSYIVDLINLGCNFFRCHFNLGVFNGGKASYCSFEYVEWNSGDFENSVWLNGEWGKRGVWRSGKDKNGKIRTTPPTEWKE